MKKTIFFAVFTMTFFLLKGEAFAVENGQTEVIEQDSLGTLTIDPTKEVPDYKIVPHPTPSPQKEEQKYEDTRSWTKSKYKEMIQKTAQTYNLDPQLIYATIMTESEGDEYAFRYEPHLKDASLGMGQILISTARSLGFTGNPKELYQPEVGIDMVGKYHRKMLNTYGELSPIQLAVAYNTGSPWKRAVRGHLFRFQKWYNDKT